MDTSIYLFWRREAFWLGCYVEVSDEAALDLVMMFINQNKDKAVTKTGIDLQEGLQR